MRRGVEDVLKMCGSGHEKAIRELIIDGKGMHIGDPFRNAAGILAGDPMQLEVSKTENLERLFPDDAP